MRIIIIGAGSVGKALTNRLVDEGNDITLVDESLERLQQIQNSLDIDIVAGRGSHPEVLRNADAENADLLIAVTDIDEINIIACRVAHTIFNVPTKMASVRTRAYLEERDSLFGRNTIPIDVLLNPDQAISRQISMLVKHPGALQVVDFTDGAFHLACVVANAGGSLVDTPLASLEQMVSKVSRVIAIYRDKKPLIPDEETVIYPGDEVFFFTPTEDLDTIISGLGKKTDPVKRLMIAGGGGVGTYLAELLQDECAIKIIESNRENAEVRAGNLDNVIVLHGDATDENIMKLENIKETDMFCAVTNDQEANILSALMAKHLGSTRVIALVNRGSYVDLIRRDHIDIDVALSSQQLAISQLLHHVRRAHTVAAYSFQQGSAEVLELVVHGDARSSRVVSRPLGRLHLPAGCVVCGLIRNGTALPIDPNLVIETQDHLVLFVTDKAHIADLEKTFSVHPDFL